MIKHNQQLTSESADIALILEGSYPLVKGGVSTWVHQLIQSFPQYTFAILFLGGLPKDYKNGIRYEIPKNVVHLQIEYLFEEEPLPSIKQVKGNKEGFDKIRDIHAAFRDFDPNIIKHIGDLNLYNAQGVDYFQFLYSEMSWDFITDQYEKYASDTSFIDYFWTIKNVHKPLWKLAKIVPTIPKVKVLHTISTGYAGFVGAMLHYHYQTPLVLSEHGIYTKERRIDIFKSKMLYDIGDIDRSLTEINYLHGLWNRYFETLAKLCYESANPIVSLFQAAHQMQLDEGAPSEKAIVIPNGVDIPRFTKLIKPFDEKKPIIAFLGRVVPIKDVKNFIRSVVQMHKKMPDLKAWIIGATEEDPEYVTECKQLVENLSLQEAIEFMPHQDVDDLYSTIRLLVLSSISESMPLVLLESFAAGVPTVATDVGACRELILGSTDEDKEIGPAGKIVKISSSNELALASLEILSNPKLWQEMSEAAVARAKKYYNEKDMIARYSQIYKERMQ